MNIYLIEDEALALEELLYLMEPFRDEHDIFAFETGEDAVAATQKALPDIVISDIRMPGIDGLETIRQLNQIHPKLQAVLLSGYNDFEYARSALKLGVKEYLLKPVIGNDLNDVMKRLLASSAEEEEKSQMMKNWSISQMIRGLYSEEDAGGSSFSLGNWMIMAILLENWNSRTTWGAIGSSAKSISVWLQSVVHVQAKCVDLDGHLRLVLFPLESTYKSNSTRQLANHIHTYFLQAYPTMHTVYTIKTDKQSLEMSYRTLLHMLEAQVRIGVSTFMSGEQAFQLSSVWDSARLMERHIREAEYAKSSLEVRRMLDNMHRAQVRMKHKAILLSDILYAIKFNLFGNKPDSEVFDMDSVYEFLKTCDHDDMVHEWLLDKLSTMMSNVHHENKIQPKQIVPALIDYVNRHYNETIQLQDFASKYHVSTGYLSKLFKAETGTNFSEYVILVRMNKAQELLAGGYRRISEISRLVGYEDPKFFSQTFKRVMGITPQDYKKQDK